MTLIRKLRKLGHSLVLTAFLISAHGCIHTVYYLRSAAVSRENPTHRHTTVSFSSRSWSSSRGGLGSVEVLDVNM